MISSFFS